jgi:hypothetical protein
MSDYLNNLVARSLNHAEVIQPRLASMFEPLQSNTGLDVTPNLSLQQPSVNAEAVSKNQISIDIETGDSLGLKLQEVGTKGKFHQESEIDMETQKILSVGGEEVAIKLDRKVSGEGDNQGFSATEETQGETTLSVVNKSLERSEPKTQGQTSTPNTHTNLQPYSSSRLDPSPDHNTDEMSMSKLPSLNTISHNHTSGEQESVNLPTLKVFRQINAIPSSKFTAARQEISGISQLREELSVEHLEEFQPGEVSTSALASKTTESSINNLDNLIPHAKKPAITMYPQVQIPTSTDTNLSEQPSSPPTPTINVTIGRIEVRATPPVAPPTKQRPKPTVMGLEEYLHQRAKGDHR